MYFDYDCNYDDGPHENYYTDGLNEYPCYRVDILDDESDMSDEEEYNDYPEDPDDMDASPPGEFYNNGTYHRSNDNTSNPIVVRPGTLVIESDHYPDHSHSPNILPLRRTSRTHPCESYGVEPAKIVRASIKLNEPKTVYTHDMRKGLGDCPICLEHIDNDYPLIFFCQYGCGRGIHDTCYDGYVRAVNKGQCKTVKCPLCRTVAPFGRYGQTN